jgi:hypothetical protein
MRRAVLVASPQREATNRSTHIMKGSEPKGTQELIGIVISGMPRTEKPSVFSAYIWAPAPIKSEDTEPQAA